MTFPILDERIVVALRATGLRTEAWRFVQSVREPSADRETFIWTASGPAFDTTTSLRYRFAMSSRGRLAAGTSPEALNSHSASENMFARSVLASQLNCAKKTMSTLLYLTLYMLLFALPLCSGSHGREDAKPFSRI